MGAQASLRPALRAAIIALVAVAAAARGTSAIAGGGGGVGLPDACAPHYRGPRFVHRAPGRSMLATLRVLRRPQRPDDLPADRHFLAEPGAAVLLDYVRLVATTPQGRRYYMVPVILPVTRYSHRCLAEVTHRQRRLLQAEERYERKRSRQVVIGVEDIDPDGGGGGGYASAAEIRRDGGGIFSSEDTRGVTWVQGFVPDGVATVTIRWHGGGRAQAPVENNTWLVQTAHHAFHALDASMLWRATDGTVIKAFPRNHA